MAISKTHNSIIALILFALLILPVVVLPTAGIFGAILAEIEGWTMLDGYLYVISNLTGLGNPLTIASPVSPDGIHFALIVSVWSMTIAGAAIGVVGNFSCIVTAARWSEGTFEGNSGTKVAVLPAAEAGEEDGGGSRTLPAIKSNLEV